MTDTKAPDRTIRAESYTEKKTTEEAKIKMTIPFKNALDEEDTLHVIMDKEDATDLVS